MASASLTAALVQRRISRPPAATNLRESLRDAGRRIDGVADAAAGTWQGVVTVYVGAFAATLAFIL